MATLGPISCALAGIVSIRNTWGAPVATALHGRLTGVYMERLSSPRSPPSATAGPEGRWQIFDGRGMGLKPSDGGVGTY